MGDYTLSDSHGRSIRTVRISVTDRCNFRCVYCMPPEGLPALPQADYLDVGAITRFARIVAGMGVKRFRVTGGEPLLRREVVDIVAALKQIDPANKVLMTTNASRLGRFVRPLKDAGLDGINISLDSLDAPRFNRVTRSTQFARVLSGIDAALELGFRVKLNVVVLAGMERDEIIAFAEFAVRHDLDVRFLEFMPLCGSGWDATRVYPIAEVRAIVAERFDLVEMPRGDRPAETYRLAGGRGRVGFIAPLSEPFCGACTRMRLTAEGKIRPCLFSNVEYPIGHLLRNGAADEEIERAIRHAVWRKPWGSEFADEPFVSGQGNRSLAPTPFIRNVGG